MSRETINYWKGLRTVSAQISRETQFFSTKRQRLHPTSLLFSVTNQCYTSIFVRIMKQRPSTRLRTDKQQQKGLSIASNSGATWARKIGKPSNRENLVMTSQYERTSFVRPFVRTDYWGGEGILVVTLTGEWKNPILSLILTGFLKKRMTHYSLLLTNDSGG